MSVIFKRTKILATLGPSTDSAEMIEKLAIAGVNGFRLNFSHGNNEQRDNHIKWVRMASDKMGKPVAIVQDLQGPKIRLGELSKDTDVKTGDIVTLIYEKPQDGLLIPVQYDLSQKVKKGERILFCDGKIKATVIEVTDKTFIKVKIENPGTLSSHKGINLPDTDFGGDILTDKDLEDIKFGSTRDFDYVAISFIQSADDIIKLRKVLDGYGSNAKIIAKVETKAAVNDRTIKEIVKVSDAVMVARGDLASEVGAEAVPIVQRKIIRLCRKYGKISIVATQMLLSMCEEPAPTRAEVSDVATAVMQGVDVVMLSDETTVGKYPVEAVTAMKKVILYTQDNETVEQMDYDIEDEDKIRDVIGNAAVTMAKELNAAAIIVDTKTGATASKISAFRPDLVVVSVTSQTKTAQQLCLRYASRNYIRPDSDHVCQDLAIDLKNQGLCGKGPATFVIVSGRQPCVTGTTDTIKVIVI